MSKQPAGRAERFFDWKGPQRGDVQLAGDELTMIDLPIRYYRTDAILGVFGADADAVASALPSSRLRPIRMRRGRAAVAVAIYNYLQTAIGPYGEVGVAALCTLDRSGPPVLPALLESRWPGFGGFVLHLPVTTRIARDAGRQVWGYPKFVADMDFEISPDRCGVELREGGAEILSFGTRTGGRLLRDRLPTITYSESGGKLVKTAISVRGTYELIRGRHAGELLLGDHVVARELRELDLDRQPFVTKRYLSHAAILPEGSTIGEVDRSYEGFAGVKARTGRHTITYDDGVTVAISEAATDTETTRAAG